jgi:hypothetical protein
MSTRDVRRFPSGPRRNLFDWLATALALGLVVGVSAATLIAKQPTQVVAVR